MTVASLSSDVDENVERDNRASEQEDETATTEEDEQEACHPEERGTETTTLSDVLYGGKRAAWSDEDNDTFAVDVTGKARSRKLRKTELETALSGREYEQRLRAQFERIYPRPTWAGLKEENSDSDSDSKDESSGLLKSTKKLLGGKTRQLLPDTLEMARHRDANQHSYSEGAITSVQFHPDSQILLTSSLDKTLRLFQVDGKVNPKIQSVHFKDLPIHRAAFVHTSGEVGTQVLITGRRKYFYTYDLQAGGIQRVSSIRGREGVDKSLERFFVSPAGDLVAFPGSGGHISIVSTKTWQWVGGVRLNGGVKSVAWKPDGCGLYSVGADSEVYLWDIRNYSCAQRFPDHGGFKSNNLAASEDGNYLAVGSRSGFVNVYDASRFDPSPTLDELGTTLGPQPLKALGNLTTSITQLKFNPDSQILGMASKLKRDQLRLVHLPSLTVFQNWPTSQTPLAYVQCFDFSPRGGYIAIGNDRGRVLLYRLLHYGSP